MPQARTKTCGLSSNRFGKMVKLLEDDDRFSSRSQSGYEESGSRSPSVYFDTVDSPDTNFGPINKKERVSSSSRLLAFNQPHISSSVQNVVVGSSDESESEFGTANKLVPVSRGLIRAHEWQNPPVSSPVDELKGNRDDSFVAKPQGSSRSKALHKHTLGWQDRYMEQPPRLHDSIAKNSLDGYPQRVSASYQTQRAYRKGSSSKAPQTNDLTEPLLLDKKSRPIIYKTMEGESEDHAVISTGVFGSKIRHSSGRRTAHSTCSGTEGLSRRKGNLHTFNTRHARFEETGAGRRDTNSNGVGSSRRGLSNLVCSSSAADVLPSVSSATLSNVACASAVDVFPSVPSTVSGSSYIHPRRSSRSGGLDGETSRRLQPLKRQIEEAQVLSMKEVQSGSKQAPHAPDQGKYQSGEVEYTHASQPEPLRTDFLSSETSIPSCTSTSTLLPPNQRLWRRNGALARNADGLRSFHRSGSSCFEANSSHGEELPNDWSSRRRGLYGNHTDSLCPDSRFFNSNFSHGRPSNGTWSILREIQYPQSRFLGPPSRPPPLPSVAGSAEPSPSENSFSSSHPINSAVYSYSSQASSFDLATSNTEQSSATATAETSSLNRTMNNGEGRLRLTVEGLSEILSALEYIERDEDLSYEQILMLEATILLGGIGLHDQYRDMRIDIDNMSYEELLALEERIGNVNTGLSEESVRRTVRVEIFTAPEISCNYVPQEIEIKCSICQEEFEESVELGVLDCGHSHHIACIKQWLLQKNQCPICKAPAMP